MNRTFSLLILSLCSSAVVSFGQTSSEYFYHGREYGSEAIYNPLSLVINGGFDVLQASAHSRALSTLSMNIGAKNVWENISNPFPQINKFGWNRFLGQEVFPTSIALTKAQYWPNYTLHLIGGGMTSRATLEWFHHYDIPYPSLWTGVTIAAYHFVNEAVENGAFVGPNVDPIADIWIFDVGGIVLFTSDQVCEFFSHTLHLTEWDGQPTYNPTFGTVENEGQNFVMKYPLPFLSHVSLFYYFGDNGMLGLSFERGNGHNITVSGGFVSKELRTVDSRNGTRTVTAELGWIAGIFYDRDNSLLASLILSDKINEKVKINMYPGVLDIAGISPGIFCSMGMGSQFIAGLTVRYVPFGLAYRNEM
jgi:hypothetical protein